METIYAKKTLSTFSGTDVGGRGSEGIFNFVRFNPDAYIDADGQKVISCFGHNKLGVCTVKKSKVEEFDERTNVLFSTLERYIDVKELPAISQEHLFFDYFPELVFEK